MRLKWIKAFECTARARRNLALAPAVAMSLWIALAAASPGVRQTGSFLTILSQPPYIAGQPLRLKAGVVPGRNGTMSFYDGTALLGTRTLQIELNGSMQAELISQGLSEGLHTLTAVFDGDGAVSQPRPVFVISRATTVSSANYRGESLAPEQIAATYGARLAVNPTSADGLPLPTTLAGVNVNVTDSLGMTRPAPLFFVGPGQINHLIPVGTAPGPASILISSLNGDSAASAVEITGVAPGVFTADSTGSGLAAALALRVRSDGSSQYEPVVAYDQISGKSSPIPIDLGPESDKVFLILFGTGFRALGAPPSATATLGGLRIDASYAGPQGGLAGLDQANLLLPRSLSRPGEIEVVLSVASKNANPVRVVVGGW